jgi:hypothetical protein
MSGCPGPCLAGAFRWRALEFIEFFVLVVQHSRTVRAPTGIEA